jgi:IS30 family transposase
VSHETIYQSLYVQAREPLRRELIAHLRRGQTTTIAGPEGIRPSFGKGMTAVATLVERTNRYLMMVALPDGHRADLVADALSERVTGLPEELRRSLTWDQGKEMAAHARFSIETGLPVYFCDPRSPWQRGTNENTNGLLRQYFPKRTSLAPFSQTDLDAVAAELNGRPRQTLDWMTPSKHSTKRCDDSLRPR